jgi:hypothetical protein
LANAHRALSFAASFIDSNGCFDIFGARFNEKLRIQQLLWLKLNPPNTFTRGATRRLTATAA